MQIGTGSNHGSSSATSSNMHIETKIQTDNCQRVDGPSLPSKRKSEDSVVYEDINRKVSQNVARATKRRKTNTPSLPLLYRSDLRKSIRQNADFKNSEVAKRYLTARTARTDNKRVRATSKLDDVCVSGTCSRKKAKRK